MADRKWRKSLRQIGPIVTASDTIVKPMSTSKARKLSVVGEDNVFDENDAAVMAAKHRPIRRRLTKGSLSELQLHAVPPSDPKSPMKKAKPKFVGEEFSKVAPRHLDISTKNITEKPLPSPIPLPPGVESIDTDEDSTLIYNRYIFAYMSERHKKMAVNVDDLVALGNRLEIRNTLAGWIVEIAHYCGCSQETLYLSVDILDRSLAKSRFSASKYQLLALAAFLIATKLDEYHHADINLLTKLCDNIYDSEDILDMELHICSILDYKLYGCDPMIVVNRFLRAAGYDSDLMFYELTIFFVDCFVIDLNLWTMSIEKKVAASILAALVVVERPRNLKEISDLWTPTLAYYTGFEDVSVLVSSARKMIDFLFEILKSKVSPLKTKYSSTSRHNALLRQTFLDIAEVKMAQKAIFKHIFNKS